MPKNRKKQLEEEGKKKKEKKKLGWHKNKSLSIVAKLMFS